MSTEQAKVSPDRPRRRRRKTERVEGARHGTTTGYTTDACRCDECFDAIRAYQDRFFAGKGIGRDGVPS